MGNNRLNQQTTSGDTGSIPRISSTDWKHLSDLNEELRSISPGFQKLETAKIVLPSAQDWKGFTRDLKVKLEESEAPRIQSLRDKITATDSSVVRWLWIAVALFALALAGWFIASSITQGPALELSQSAARAHIYADSRHGTEAPIRNS